MSYIHLLAEKIESAFVSHAWHDDPIPDFSLLTLDEAYQVQNSVCHIRAQKGNLAIGYKVGCTSAAIRSQFGLTEPICGRIFQAFNHVEGAELDWNDYLQLAIEPEIVLHIGRDLSGESLSDDELLQGINAISVGIELHQFKFWQTPPTSQELICSGGIHAGLVVGNKQASTDSFSFESEVFKVFRDGELVTSAPASEIMGGPLHSLRWLVAFLSHQGKALPAGSLVIPGSPVKLISIDRNMEIRVEIENIGSLTTQFRTSRLS